MPRSKTSSTSLIRWLDKLERPVYVVDEERRLVYCNQALAELLGVEAKDMIGQQCAFHGEAGTAKTSAAVLALCPPPDVLSGARRQAVIAVPAKEKCLERLVDFTPLGDAGAAAGVLAVMAATDHVAEQPAADSQPLAPDTLHRQLLHFRRQFAGRNRLDRFVGPSAASERVRRQLTLAASSTVPVLVWGPPGSGKRFAAAAIHYQPARPEAALVTIECAQTNLEMLQAALGQSTLKSTPGALGTLLLVDVEQLDAAMQPFVVQLARHAGAAWRIVATSTLGPVQLAQTESLHSDLVQLLSTLDVELVPLRERLEDLPLLAQQQLEELNARGEKQLLGLSPEALERLAAYRWPGNLPELSEVIAAAHAKATSHSVTSRDLPERLRQAADAVKFTPPREEPIVLDEFLAQIERELIERSLERAGRNKSKAARQLGLTRPKLYRRMVQLGLEPPDGDADAAGE